MSYWKEIHSEARQRMRKTGFLEWKRLSTSVGIPIVVGFIQWWRGVTLFANLIFSVGVGIALYICLMLVERYVHTRAIVVEQDAAFRKTINDRDSELERIRSEQAKIPGAYSDAEIAKLARLQREGNELYKVTISVNHPNTTLELDAWFKKHNYWREEVLSILHIRDAVIFEGPITAGSQTIGNQGALNRIHGDRRGQVLEELARIGKVIERHGA